MSLAGIHLGPHDAEYVYFNSITNLAPLAILYYDYLLTFPLEVQFLWSPGNQGWLTLACLINRYLPLFGHIPLAVSYLRSQRDIPFCQGLHLYHEIFGIFMQVLAGLLCMIRVYALYGRNRRVLAALLMVGAASILFTSWAMVASRRDMSETIEVISSLPGCNQYLPSEGARDAALAWIGVLVFDSAIFSLTLYKAFTTGRGIRLLNVIVRDGTMYFSALFIMNLANILMLMLAPPLLKNSTASITNVLSITLISRLMLNLRAQSSAQAGLPSSIESERRFQAGLPVARPPPPMSAAEGPVTDSSNKSTGETGPPVPGPSHLDFPGMQVGEPTAL